MANFLFLGLNPLLPGAEHIFFSRSVRQPLTQGLVSCFTFSTRVFVWCQLIHLCQPCTECLQAGHGTSGAQLLPPPGRQGGLQNSPGWARSWGAFRSWSPCWTSFHKVLCKWKLLCVPSATACYGVLVIISIYTMSVWIHIYRENREIYLTRESILILLSLFFSPNTTLISFFLRTSADL